jgi:hypothetical protein
MDKINLNNIFSYHAPIGDQTNRYECIREAAKVFAQVILNLTPECEDQGVVIRKIREAVMTANASIALNETSESNDDHIDLDPTIIEIASEDNIKDDMEH